MDKTKQARLIEQKRNLRPIAMLASGGLVEVGFLVVFSDVVVSVVPE